MLFIRDHTNNILLLACDRMNSHGPEKNLLTSLHALFLVKKVTNG